MSGKAVRGFHKAVGGMRKRERECCDGTLTCLLKGCNRPSAGWVATWHGPEPVCEVHLPGAESAGYAVTRTPRESIAAALHALPDDSAEVYHCSACNAHGHWGPGWLWYGDWIRGASRILCPDCSEPYRHEVIP